MTANVYGISLASLLGWINVKAAPYSAKGDGVTDDTAAIQAAINAVGSNGGVVYFPTTTAGYLLNSSALSVATAGTILLGAGAENTKLLIGSSFTGTAAVSITGYNCQVRDVSINGNSSTTTSNPVCNAVEITGVRRAKVSRCTFFSVNGWAIEAAATTANGTSNPLGTQLAELFMSNCAGGVHFLGNTTQGYAVNSSITDLQFYLGGVTSGASANLDAIRIEDAWDVLVENAIVWMSSGTGSSLHIKGNSAASFVKNLDALGPNTAPCVLVEDGTNGSVQNAQITGGVIQQGSIGLRISGGSNQVHVNQTRIINNQTHGVQVDGTSKPIHIYNVFFNLNGAGASGTNYDVNWSGSAQGKVTNCWFGSNIVATGTAGVQQSINIGTAGQAVLVEAAAFQGTGASSSNWFTNLPAGVLEASSGVANWATGVTFSGSGTALTAKNTMAAQPSASGNTVLSTNVSGTDAFDRFRLLGSGTIAIGPGTAARDAQIARTAVGTLQLTNPNTSHAATWNVDGLVSALTTALNTGASGGKLLTVTNTTSAPTADNVLLTSQAAGDATLGFQVSGDTKDRFTIDSTGKQQWGPGGSTALDTDLYRVSAGTLTTDGSFTVGGNLDIYNAGRGLQIGEGSNAKMGTATMSAGTVTVSNTSVTATSRIFLTIQSTGGTVGSVYVSARTAGTSFTIKSTSSSDTSTVAYFIVEPG